MKNQIKNLITTVIGNGPYKISKRSKPLRNPKSDVKANIEPYQHKGKGTRKERKHARNKAN